MSTLGTFALATFALLIPILCLKEHFEHQAIRDHGVEVDATIVGGYSKEKRGVTSHTLRIEAVYDGTTYSDPVSVDQSIFDKHVSGGFISDPQIRIKLNPSSPNEFLVAADLSGPPAWLWAVAILSGSFGIWKFMGLARDIRDSLDRNK